MTPHKETLERIARIDEAAELTCGRLLVKDSEWLLKTLKKEVETSDQWQKQAATNAKAITGLGKIMEELRAENAELKAKLELERDKPKTISPEEYELLFNAWAKEAREIEKQRIQKVTDELIEDIEGRKEFRNLKEKK